MPANGHIPNLQSGRGWLGRDSWAAPEGLKRETERRTEGAMEKSKVFRVIAIVAIVIVPMQAASAATCMTKSEARRVYSTSHLYWHGANHCWDATSGGRRYAERRRHHFVRQHRDEDEVTQAEPQAVVQVAQAQPQPVQEPTPSPAPALTPPALTPPELTPSDLIRVGHTLRIEELESTLRDRWPDTHMEIRTKPRLIEAATAEAQPSASVGIVMLSIGGILVICTILVSFGVMVEQRRHGRYV